MYLPTCLINLIDPIKENICSCKAWQTDIQRFLGTLEEKDGLILSIINFKCERMIQSSENDSQYH